MQPSNCFCTDHRWSVYAPPPARSLRRTHANNLQPPNVKEVVERIVSTPLDGLEAALQGFKWSFDKVRPLRCIERAIALTPRAGAGVGGKALA